MEIIMGLLKDRVTVEKASDAKKRRVDEKYGLILLSYDITHSSFNKLYLLPTR